MRGCVYKKVAEESGNQDLKSYFDLAMKPYDLGRSHIAHSQSGDGSDFRGL